MTVVHINYQDSVPGARLKSEVSLQLFKASLVSGISGSISEQERISGSGAKVLASSIMVLACLIVAVQHIF